jgi:glycosyltransferase involved in cell wall biosynthesis
MPKVSVIIPTYNRAGVLTRAVQSVLAQTLQNFELIIVDDGSQDATREIVGGFEDSRIRYFFKSNGGAASARNLGLSKAAGDFVSFLDSDDAWPANYLEVMTSHLKNNSEYGAVYSPITVVYPDGIKIKSYKKPEGKSGWITLELFKSGFIWPSASLFRTSVWEGFFFDESLKTSEDSDAFLRLSMHTKFKFVDSVEALHTMSPDSLSVEVGVACTRFLVLERFYYKLGGHIRIPEKEARRKISHACRKVAEDRRLKGERKASVALYRRAIRHRPTDIRLYWGLMKNFQKSEGSAGSEPPIIPGILGDPVGPNRSA